MKFSGNFQLTGNYSAGGSSSASAFTGTLLHTLANPNAVDTWVTDFFGYSVAVSGDRAIVGAYYESGPNYDPHGAAYIYNVATGELLHTLINPNPYNNVTTQFFGQSVGISDTHAIVGAPASDTASASNTGHAYIYDTNTGNLLHTLNNPNAYGTADSDSFGSSVAINGNYAIVTANSEDNASVSSSGVAYIFDVTTGSLLHTITNPNAYGTADDGFGNSVAISGDRAIVGARAEDDAGGLSSGAAYIFDVTTGNLLHTLTNPNAYDTSAGDNFGRSVAISNSHAIVGANAEDDAGGADSGAAYIFDVSTGNLLHTITNPNAFDTSANDRFGWSVAISGDRAIVGAYLEDDAGGTSSGVAYIFDVTTGNLLHTLTNPNAYGTSATGDYFGWSVAISDSYAVIGAYQEDSIGSSSGAAYIYN